MFFYVFSALKIIVGSSSICRWQGVGLSCGSTLSPVTIETIFDHILYYNRMIILSSLLIYSLTSYSIIISSKTLKFIYFSTSEVDMSLVSVFILTEARCLGLFSNGLLPICTFTPPLLLLFGFLPKVFCFALVSCQSLTKEKMNVCHTG